MGSLTGPPVPVSVCVFNYVKSHPGLTAHYIAKVLGEKPSTVSSYLYKMVKKGKLVRLPNCGPKNGYGYFLPGMLKNSCKRV